MTIAFDINNTNKVVELTQQLLTIPNNWHLLDTMGLFTEQGVTQQTVALSSLTEVDGLPVDRNWDDGRNALKPSARAELSFPIPHFPLDTEITPRDLQGVLSWTNFANGVGLETMAAIRLRKMETMMRRFAKLREVARMQIITSGTVYAPSGTLARSYGNTVNFYNEFGVTRTDILTDLGNVNVDPLTYTGQIISGIQDGLLNGEVVSDYIVVCSPEYFAALVTNPYITEVYKYFRRDQDPLVNRLNNNNPMGLDARFQTFTFGGVTFIEYRGTYTDTNGTVQRFVPAGDAYAFPLGVTDMFQTYYAPMLTFPTVNQVGQATYYMEFMGQKQDKLEIMSESNMLNACLRPQAIIRLHLS